MKFKRNQKKERLMKEKERKFKPLQADMDVQAIHIQVVQTPCGPIMVPNLKERFEFQILGLIMESCKEDGLSRIP